jgi:hypothetical protein
MAAPILQFKRGVVANLPGLRAGEPGFTTDSYELYVGVNSTTQENKFFGSHRYWTRETTSTGSGLNLVEGTSNGSDFITLKSPNTLAGIVTYTFPASPVASNILTTDANGVLSWSSPAAPVFAGIYTFTDATDNTLGDENTGSIQLDGGMGIAKNLTVKQNLHVGGYAEFVGVVTFRGGTINIGDGNTDNINVGGEFISGLAPSVDNTYDIGISTQKWRDAYFSGIGSFATGAYIDAVQIGITATNEIDTTSGNLILDSAAGTVEIQDNLTVSGITTLTGLLDANGGLDVTGHTVLNNTLAVTGISTFTGAIDANGGASIDNIQIGVTGDNEIDTSTGSLTLDSASGQTIIDDNLSVTGIATITGAFVANGNVTLGDTSGDIITINGTTTFNQPLVGTIGTATRATTLDTTGTSDGTTYFLTFADTSAGQQGETLRVGAGATYVPSTNKLSVTTLSGSNIQAADGTSALTISNTTGAVSTNSDLTVGGDLYVSGNTTQVNTASLTVEDRTIDLGIVNGAAPASTTTWDLGVLFNYNSSGAKKSAVVWEHGDARFKFASVLNADTNGTDNNTPQLTVTTFAPVEIGSLWVTDCAGTSQVISCTGTTRNLENITIDAGTFV